MCSSKKAFYRQGISPGKSNLKFIYCFLANIEHPLRLSEKLRLYPSMRYMNQTREKWDLFWVELTFKGYEDTMIVCVSIFIFCLEPTVREQLMRAISVTIMVIVSKVPFWNYLITAMFKVLLQHLGGTLTTAFEVTPYS